MSSGPNYTEAEDQIIRKHYASASWAELEVLIPSRSRNSIRIRANRLGLKKLPETLEFGMPFDGSVIGHLPETDKAYLAGIMDGEGCFGLYRYMDKKRKTPTYRFYVSIANCSPLLYEWLNERFKGRTYLRKETRKAGQWRASYQWMLAGNKQVMVFCREIAPFLVIKREQAERLSKGYLHLSEEERVHLVDEMKQLKRVS